MQPARYIVFLIFSVSLLGFSVYFLRQYLTRGTPVNQDIYEGYIYEQPVLDGRFKKLEVNGRRLYLSRYMAVNQGDYVQIDFSTCQYSGEYNNYSYCEVEIDQDNKHGLLTDIFKMRQSIISKAKTRLPSPHDSLVLAMTIGYEDDLPETLTEKLREIGAIHMLVVSGYNVSLILNSSGVLLMRFGRANYLIFSISILLLFLFITGFDPPIVRAVIMGTFIVLSRVLDRPGNALYFLILSAILMVAWDFGNLSNLSFQLSFSATFGVIIFNEIFKFKNNLANDLSASVGASLFVLPIISFYFKTINVLAILSSILLGWLVPYITYLGFFLFLSGNVVLRAILVTIVDLFLFLSDLISRLTFTNLEYQIIPRDLFLYYVFIGLALFFVYRVKVLRNPV